MPSKMIIEDAKVDELWWQKRNLSYTTTGYGGKIPTRYKVKVGGRWYRVYCAIFSNAGTCYICRGKTPKGQRYTMENVVENYAFQEAFALHNI